MADKKTKAEAEQAEPVTAEQAPKAEKKAAKADSKAYTPRLKTDYDDRIVKAMTEKFGYKNRFEVPKL